MPHIVQLSAQHPEIVMALMYPAGILMLIDPIRFALITRLFDRTTGPAKGPVDSVAPITISQNADY